MTTTVSSRPQSSEAALGPHAAAPTTRGERSALAPVPPAVTDSPEDTLYLGAEPNPSRNPGAPPPPLVRWRHGGRTSLRPEVWFVEVHDPAVWPAFTVRESQSLVEVARDHIVLAGSQVHVIGAALSGVRVCSADGVAIHHYKVGGIRGVPPDAQRQRMGP
jgi:hypothetical protein